MDSSYDFSVCWFQFVSQIVLKNCLKKSSVSKRDHGCTWLTGWTLRRKRFWLERESWLSSIMSNEQLRIKKKAERSSLVFCSIFHLLTSTSVDHRTNVSSFFCLSFLNSRINNYLKKCSAKIRKMILNWGNRLKFNKQSWNNQIELWHDYFSSLRSTCFNGVLCC